MKNEFSKTWKSSTQPRKQRKYRVNAPLHLKNVFMSAHLSKELIKKYGKRSIVVRKGDTVKAARGQFKGKSGKVEKVSRQKERIFVNGMDIAKKDGSRSMYPIHPSNLIITELILDDKKRVKSLERK